MLSKLFRVLEVVVVLEAITAAAAITASSTKAACMEARFTTGVATRQLAASLKRRQRTRDPTPLLKEGFLYLLGAITSVGRMKRLGENVRRM